MSGLQDISDTAAWCPPSREPGLWRVIMHNKSRSGCPILRNGSEILRITTSVTLLSFRCMSGNDSGITDVRLICSSALVPTCTELVPAPRHDTTYIASRGSPFISAARLLDADGSGGSMSPRGVLFPGQTFEPFVVVVFR